MVAFELGDVLPFEVALVGQPVGLREGEGVGAEGGRYFGCRPDVRGAFVVIRIGVERGGEQAVGGAHLAEEPVDRLDADVDVERITVARPGLGVGAKQLSVVVQHLLEVRYGPVAVDAVAVETAPDLVEQSAPGHRTQRDRQDGVDARGEGPVGFDRGGAADAEQEVERVRRRELRRGTETSEGIIMLLADATSGGDKVVG